MIRELPGLSLSYDLLSKWNLGGCTYVVHLTIRWPCLVDLTTGYSPLRARSDLEMGGKRVATVDLIL
jgi:hypothetical protein